MAQRHRRGIFAEVNRVALITGQQVVRATPRSYDFHPENIFTKETVKIIEKTVDPAFESVMFSIPRKSEGDVAV